MEVKNKINRVARSLGYTPKQTKEDVGKELNNLTEQIAFAGGLRRLINSDDAKYLNAVLAQCTNDALIESKMKRGTERDEAIGKLKMLDDINITINSILKKGDEALLQHKTLEDKYNSMVG
jgi:CMP-2-keto-3-deoxyoctulosonic acid synthetase